MKGDLKNLLAIERKDERKKKLEGYGDNDLLKFVSELVTEAQGKNVNVGLLGNKNLLKVQSSENDDEETNQRRNEKRNQIVNQALGVLEKLGQKLKHEEVGGLAIDREYDDVKDKMNAIVEDINSGRMPAYMYHRVLEVNFFDEDEKQSRTFLAYAWAKIKNTEAFLDNLKIQLGDNEFANYLETTNYLGTEDKRADVFDLYLKDLGEFNKAEREALSQESKDALLRLQAEENRGVAVQVQNVDTHQISTHKSADESHVTAFKMMVEATELGVVAEYKKPMKETDPSREVEITDRGTLDTFVAKQNLEFRKQIDDLVKLTDQDLFNYLKKNNLELFEGQEEVIRIWNASGKITGEARAALKKEFEEKHREEFVAYYKGYIPDDAFYNVIENALDNIPVPEQLKKQHALESMGVEEIYQAIKNCKLPLLHSNSERGIESTLNYLSHLEGKENIIADLVNRAISEDKKEPSVQNVLHFLSRSNIPQEQREVEVISFKGMPITIGDIAVLPPQDLAGLFSIKPTEFLEESIRRRLHILFLLYVKKVGLNDEEVNQEFGSYRSTPLQIGAQFGHAEVVKLLLERGVDVNKADNIGRTPLHRATENGHAEVVKLLLEKGVDVNKADRDFYTPLHKAAENGHAEVVKLLLEKGVDVNKADNMGRTPLHWASKNGHFEVVKALVAKGANVNKADSDFYTPLYKATENGRVEVVKELLKHKAIDVNMANRQGITPLHVAAWNGNIEIVKELLKHNNIDVDKKGNKFGDTPLFRAIMLGHVEVTNTLLSHGACPSLSLLFRNRLPSEVNSKMRSIYFQSCCTSISTAATNICSNPASIVLLCTVGVVAALLISNRNVLNLTRMV